MYRKCYRYKEAMVDYYKEAKQDFKDMMPQMLYVDGR